MLYVGGDMEIAAPVEYAFSLIALNWCDFLRANVRPLLKPCFIDSGHYLVTIDSIFVGR